MGAVALAVIWLGYAAGTWGYCLVRGYCVTPMNVISPSFPASKANAQGTAGLPSGGTRAVS
ncbi:MAG TPA: hypothetical protein VGI05_26660 [Streptosporangiaceae bacterium]|jgi:hypothetical protein